MLFMTEFWERFAFYGIRWALTLYIVAAFFNGDASGQAFASRTYGAYLALVYATAVFGGYVADKIIGYQRSILLGASVMAAGLFMIMMNGRARMIGQQQTMQDLATRLTNLMNRPVTDATTLKAKYDFTLTYSPEGMNGPMGLMPPPPPPPAGGGGAPASSSLPEAEPLLDIFGAVQAQLGLKLEPKKGPVDLIVIDHAEKTPTEN